MPRGILPKLKAITRQQRIVPTTLYRNSALSLSLLHSFSSVCSVPSCCSSSLTLNRGSMAASTSKAVLRDVYVDDIISSCGSVLELTKPTGVYYFKDGTRKGSLRPSVNVTRPQPLNVLMNFGCSTFDANWRNRNSSLLHGLKNSSFACYSAGAAHDVSFDGSTRDEQLASSTFSTTGTYLS